MFLPTARQSTSNTIQFFEHAGGSIILPDVDPATWFSRENIRSGTVLTHVNKYIAHSRHHGGTANYLYLDGHIETISSKVIEDWCKEGFNFAEPGKGLPPR